MRIAPIAAAVLALCAGCLKSARAVKPGELGDRAEVVLVGEASLDPAVGPGYFPNHLDPFGLLDKVELFFTFDPNTPLSGATFQGAELMAYGVDPKKPFQLAVPRRPLYLRMIRMLRSATPSHARYVTCTGRKKIDIRPSDEVIFVGQLLCEHVDETPRGIRVRNTWDERQVATEKAYPQVKVRIAQDLDHNPAANEQVHVASAGPGAAATPPAPAAPATPAQVAVGRGPGKVVAASAAAALPRLTGRLRFAIGGEQVPVRELLHDLGAEGTSVELGVELGPVAPDGRFSLRSKPGVHRLDHVVFHVPGASRHSVFFAPRRITSADGTGCLGTLELSFPTRKAIIEDREPKLRIEDDCPPGTFLAMDEPPAIDVPTYDDAFLVRVATGTSVGVLIGGPFSAVGGLAAGFSLRTRLTVLREPGRYGTSFLELDVSALRGEDDTTLTRALAGLAWGGHLASWTMGLHAGAATSRSAPLYPVVALSCTIGTSEASLNLRLERHWSLGRRPDTAFVVGLQLAPVAIAGGLL